MTYTRGTKLLSPPTFKRFAETSDVPWPGFDLTPNLGTAYITGTQQHASANSFIENVTLLQPQGSKNTHCRASQPQRAMLPAIPRGCFEPFKLEQAAKNVEPQSPEPHNRPKFLQPGSCCTQTRLSAESWSSLQKRGHACIFP